MIEEESPKKKNPIFKIEICGACSGTSVEAPEGLCRKWRAEYLDAFNRAARGNAADLTAFHEAHRNISKIISQYPACRVCGGEGGVAVLVSEKTLDQNPLRQFFEDGDGWLV